MTTIWNIAIDWDRDGSFAGPHEDVTERTISARWFLGLRRAFQDTADDAMLTLVLDNSDQHLSPEYSSSPLYGKLTPFKPIRIESNDGTTPRIHWAGWIESIHPKVNQFGERTVEITAAGPMQFYKAAETSIELQENVRTDQIIAALLKEVVIPPAMTSAWFIGRVGNSEVGKTTFLANATSYSDLDAGNSTLAIAADNWVDRGGRTDDEKDTFDVYRAIKDVVAAERGRFLFDRTGKALFWNRHHLLDEEESLATFDNSMTGLSYQYAGLDYFKNEISVTCHPRAVSPTANEILWQLDDEVRIPAGKDRTVTAKFRDDTDNRIGGREITLTSIEFSEGEAGITIEPGANSATLKATNVEAKDAILTSCFVRGRKITDFGRMEAEATDSDSIVDYGRRVINFNLPSVDNYDDAYQIAHFELKRRSHPRGMVGSMSLLSHGVRGGDQHDQQLARTCGDKITIQEAQTAHDASYYIVGEEHKLSAGKKLFETTWYLEPAPTEYPWKLGVEGRSNVGQNSYLTY